ncbi:MAG TPA: hypothetical protein VMA36_18380 [Candidatus Limnocylindria bacterium]|jgi:hypothetical protein|nr:hypothetical protein [Candidatus Limnocylindria bacterium]
MRSIVLSLAVALSATLTACSGGGQVLGTGGNDPDHVLISVAGQLNVARVNAGSSLILSAQDVKGEQNGAIYNNTFTWHAALATATSSYPTTAFGTSGTEKPCATATLAGSTAPYTPDYTPYLRPDTSNPANVVFTPPATIPGSPTLSTTANAYCAIVTATATNGVIGTIIVAIVNPSSPQQ